MSDNQPVTAEQLDFRQMLRSVSRTFTLSIERLPGILSESVTLAYLMLRVSDYLEDNEVMPAERKVALLNVWADVLDGETDPTTLAGRLDGADPDDPEAFVVYKAEQILNHLDRLPPEIRSIIREEVKATTVGMARWQSRGPVVVNEADLDDYMFEVAGRVGHMLTHIFAWYARPIRELKDQLMPLSKEYGLALQTVNVIRGLRSDYERGWIFVPESFCQHVGLKPPELFKPENLESAQEVVSMLADKAEGHLQHGLRFIKLIPRRYHNLRLACMWPLFFAVRTLAISRGNREVLESEAKMTRQEVRQIIRDTQVMGWSNRWLDDYYQRLSVVHPTPTS